MGCACTVNTSCQRQGGTAMGSRYVTFKMDKPDGDVTVLRNPTAAIELRRGIADFAWAVQTGSGGGPRPAPQSSVFFEVGDVFPETNIPRLEMIPETKFNQIRRSGKAARFEPWKDFDHAAQEALGLS